MIERIRACTLVFLLLLALVAMAACTIRHELPPSAMRTLTTSSEGNGRINPLPGTYSRLVGADVTVMATPAEGYRISSWGGDCSTAGTAPDCEMTLDADRTATVTFERITHPVAITVTGSGTVGQGGSTSHEPGAEVTLRARWDDAAHDFAGWGGDCSVAGLATSCVLTMDEPKVVSAAFAELPAGRCTTSTAADCIRAVYTGAPYDYAQVRDIPGDALLTARSDGRYYVQRAQQITVVTAPPAAARTRFYLQPEVGGEPSQVSRMRLQAPAETTYTFTVEDDDDSPTLITFGLTARPHPAIPAHKASRADVVVSTVFSVETATLTYNHLDVTGQAATPGSYAILTGRRTAITTYQALRDGSASSLLIHQSDAFGASQAAVYKALETGDIVEWHESPDCFVRYLVTDVKPDPVGSAPRKLLVIEGMTYAFTGCSGTIPDDVIASIRFGALPDLGGLSLSAPVVHGIYQIVPPGWEYETKQSTEHASSSYSRLVIASNVAVAQTLEFWRSPALPEGWSFRSADNTGSSGPGAGYCSYYLTNERTYQGRPVRFPAFTLCGHQATRRWSVDDAWWHDGGSVRETRVIAGRPAIVIYSPEGPLHSPIFPLSIWVYDAQTRTEYYFRGQSPELRGAHVDAAAVIVRGLFEAE